MIGRSQKLICALRIVENDFRMLRKIHNTLAVSFVSSGGRDNQKTNRWSDNLVLSRNRRKYDLTYVPRKELVNVASKIVNSAPVSVQPYMRLMRIDKPIGDF